MQPLPEQHPLHVWLSQTKPPPPAPPVPPAEPPPPPEPQTHAPKPVPSVLQSCVPWQPAFPVHDDD
jgi:hypothetical protein